MAAYADRKLHVRGQDLNMVSHMAMAWTQMPWPAGKCLDGRP